MLEFQASAKKLKIQIPSLQFYDSDQRIRNFRTKHFRNFRRSFNLQITYFRFQVEIWKFLIEKINTYRLFHAANLQAFRAKGLKIDVNILFIKSNSNFERQFAGARDNRSFVNRLTDGASDYYYIYRAAWPDDEFLIRASDSPALCWPRRWLRGWDFCFCFPSPGHSLCPAIFMHGHLARKFVGR